MDNMKLLIAIIKFLKSECKKKETSKDTCESLEVAIQCLQAAYDLKPDDLELPQHQASRSLADIFHDVEPEIHVPKVVPVSAKDIEEAEKFKNCGNDLMKSDRADDAVNAYTQAIKSNAGNAVYYCNRAAAYSKLANYKAAIKDCECAVGLDPNYSKAYGRMGLAYGSLGDVERAIGCYRKAVELDPTNESSKLNLQIAEEKRKADNATSSVPNSPLDVSSLLSNPVLRNMANSVMQDPNMVNLMSGLMSHSLNESGSEGGIDALLQAGQRLAAQMQAANPSLVEQLRQQFACGNQNNQNSQNSEDNDSSSK